MCNLKSYLDEFPTHLSYQNSLKVIRAKKEEKKRIVL